MKNFPILTLIAALGLGFSVVACSDDGGSDEETETSSGDGDGDPAGDGDGDATGDGDGDSGDGDGDSGDGDGDTAGDGDGDAACAEMTLAAWMGGEEQISAEDGMVGTDLPDLTRVEFWAANEVGTVDLGSDGQNNYADCTTCFRVFEDIEGMDIARQYFQSAGSFEITELGGNNSEIVGSYTGVRLVEVTIGDDFTSTPVPDGACVDIVDGEFDTLAP